MASEKFTLNGYSFLVWFKENKDVLKNGLAAISAAAVLLSSSPNVKIASIAGITFVVTKKALDLLDYFFKE
jgi:hypothetical protein